MDKNNQYGALNLQEKLLQLLKSFHAFCVKNDITYSLDWGSLLGAIRDKGFIPWDDDLDIMVDRDNYNKLLRCIQKDNELLFDNKNLKTYWIGRVRWAKDDGSDIYPATIDVLIVDKAPDSIIARKIRVFIILMIQGMLKVYPNFKKGNCLLRLSTIFTYYFGKLFSRDFKLKLYGWLAQLSNKANTRQVTSYYEEYNCMGKYYSKDLLNEVVLVPFEDTEAYVVKDYQECLTIQFGSNYMTPIKQGLNHTERYLKRMNDHA